MSRQMSRQVFFPLFALCALTALVISLTGATGARQIEEGEQNQNDEDLAYYSYNFAHTAYGSSTHSAGFPAEGVVNGDRTGADWGGGAGGWNDGTPNVFPDYLEVHFERERVIDRLDIFSLQDNYSNPVQPTREMTFSLYGLVEFDVLYFDAALGQWRTFVSVRNNNKVWRQVFFEPVKTQKISIAIIRALSTWSRVVEVEAWGSLASQPQLPPPPAPSPTPTPNPCGEPGAGPCQLTVNLFDAVRNKAKLTYRLDAPTGFFANWRKALNWNFNDWSHGYSKNIPVLAHSLALWRSTNPAFRAEWDDPADEYPNPDPVGWWLTYLNCQNGNACSPPSGSTLQYLKADETLSNTYDADTTRAVVAVYHWAVKETSQGRGNARVEQLLQLSMEYLRFTWSLYALSAGPGPAEFMKHRGNRDKPPTGQRCQANSNGYWYDGPFLALAGMRSSWAHLCQEDRGQMFTRALLPDWNTMARNLPAGAAVNTSRETNAQGNLLNEIQAQQDGWKAQFPGTYPTPSLNAYALDAGQRQLIVGHILNGNSGQFFRDFLAKVRLRVKYHFLGWVDAAGQQVRLTVMETNTNRNTIPTYAVLYRHATRTSEALMPWNDESVATLNSACFKNPDCELRQDTSEGCYFRPNDKKGCWTRPEREDVTLGQAFLANSSNLLDNINPVKVWGSNIGPGEDPAPVGKRDIHGTIVEQITSLNVPSAASGRRRYHIIFYKDREPEKVW